MQQAIQEQSPATCKALRALLLFTRVTNNSASTSPSDLAACKILHSTLTSSIPYWLQDIPVDEQQLATDLVSALSPELEHMPRADVADMVNVIMSAFEQNKPHCCILLELLPLCLVCLSAVADAEQDGSVDGAVAAGEAADGGAAEQADAASHLHAAVHRLLQCKWQPQQVNQLLQVLKLLPFNPDQLRRLIDKAFSACRSASLHQLPPILYQLMLLSAAGQRHTALRGLKRLFEYLESQPEHQQSGSHGRLPGTTLMQVQATLLMHIHTLLKYDAGLGNDWVKQFKTYGPTSNHFILQIALTMMGQHKLEQQMQQIFKKVIMQACEDEALQVSATSCSTWLASLPTASSTPKLKALETGLLTAVRCSTFASELVCPGLLQLCANLLSSSCNSPLHIVLASRTGSLPQQASAGTRAIRLGLVVLQEVFERHQEARGEVLKLCQAQLSCSNLNAALPHVLLLSGVCREQPELLASYMPQLKDCLGTFAGLLVAIRGFLCLILQHLSDAAPAPPPQGSDFSQAGCSQASLSQMSSLSGAGGVNLLHELAGVLRRALNQQATVREALYKGLLQVVAADPGSLELLSELLLPHLKALMPEDDAQLPPLQVQRCAQVVQGSPVLMEPLPALLSCVRHLVSLPPPATTAAAAAAGFPNSSHPPSASTRGNAATWDGTAGDAADSPSSTALKRCFASIRSRLSDCCVDYFNLGSAADLNPLQPEGLVGQLHAANVLGMLEVVMEEVVKEAEQLREAEPDADQRDGDQVNQLGQELQKLYELHRAVYITAVEGGRCAGKKGKSRSAAGTGEAAADDDDPQQLPASYDVNQPSYHVELARDASFRGFVLRSCANLLESAQATAVAQALLGSTVLQQEEPEVKHVALARTLLDMYIRFHGTDDLLPLKVAADEIQLLIGDTHGTQATQEHGTHLPLLTSAKTAQPCATAVLGYVEECVAQLERLLAAHLKAGVLQEGDAAGSAQALARSRLAAATCERLQGLLQIVKVLVNTVLAMPSVLDQQMRLLTRAYKLLTGLAKAHQLPKGTAAARFSSEFEALVVSVHKLTPDVHAAVTDAVSD
eukprot:gene11123-11277_t